MDAVGFAQETFEAILDDYRDFASQIGLDDFTAIPLSALKGDNVTEASPNTPWYRGPALMEFLETVEVEQDLQYLPFRMPVQWVNRPNQDFRGFSGMISSGVVKTGDRVKALPSGRESRVARIVTHDGDLEPGHSRASPSLSRSSTKSISAAVI